MNCLSDLDIHQLLDSSNDVPEPGWEQHLESCAACRRKLENNVGSADDWTLAKVSLTLNGTLQSTTTLPQRDVRESDSTKGKFTSSPLPAAGGSSFFYQLQYVEKGPEAETSRGQNEATEVSLGEIQSVLDKPGHPENLGRIGRYEVERVVGRGGMGIVFKGFDSELNRPVAVKVLSPHLSGHGTARQRFTREAKAAAAVVHDNVVQIYDIKSSTERPFIVMPYVAGMSLQGHIDHEGQLDVENLLQVSLQIASGLEAAHCQGLVHRDIKPGNILLENGLNRIQITDFGLARAADDAAMTRSGMIAGTPHYMSPEQARGDSLDHRSDLFSLGCVMYFMATGRTLYRGDGPYSLIAQVCEGNYTPIRELNPRIPEFVGDIIDKLLELEPRDRFESARHLANDLEQALAHLHQPTRNPAPKRILNSKRRQRRRTIQAWSGAVAIVLILSAVWIFGSNWNRPAPTPETSWDAAISSQPLFSPGDVDFQLDAVEQSLSSLESSLEINSLKGGLTPDFAGEFNPSVEVQQLLIEVAEIRETTFPATQPSIEGSNPKKRVGLPPDGFPGNGFNAERLQPGAPEDDEKL